MSNSSQKLDPLIPYFDSGSVFLEGPAGTGKTTQAIEHLLRLLKAGVPGDSILVLTPQRTLAIPFERALRSPEAGSGSQVTLLTIGGLARRMVDLFWPIVGEAGGFSNPNDPPIFLTLETAQYYMAHLIQPLVEEERLFDSVSIDRNRLYSQILDNLNKAAVVGFPHTEIGERLKSAWMGEPGQFRVYEDVQTCANAFRSFCLGHNLLDFSLQIEVFRELIWPLPQCRGLLKATFRHLIYDNLEEDPPIAHRLVQEWFVDFESVLLIYDWEAGYRRFLGADPLSGCQLRSLCDHQIATKDSLTQSPGIHRLQDHLGRALEPVDSPHFLFTEPCVGINAEPEQGRKRRSSRQADKETTKPLAVPFISRFFPEMLDWVAKTIEALVKDGISPGEIVVLAPYLSDALRFSLVDRLSSLNIPARSHRPSRSLREEPATECLLTLAAIAHPNWEIRPTRFDVAYAFMQAIQDLDLVRAQLLAEIVYHPKGEDFWLTSFDRIRPEMQERITYRLGERYEKIRTWIQTKSEPSEDLDHFLSRLFGEVLSQPGYGFHTRYDTGQTAANLIESVRKFRWAAGGVLAKQNIPLGKEYLQMVQDGVIAAQYLGGWQLEAEDAVLLAPAYTFLMANRPVDIQIWLDIGSRSWLERLYQPLTHPYVLSSSWSTGQVWTDADEYATGKESLRRLVLGLLRRCRSRLYLGLSELNEQGYEQRGPLLAAFQTVLRELAL